MNIFQKRKKRTQQVILVLVFITFATILYGLNTGSLKISPLNVLYTFLGQGSDIEKMVLFDYRLPRIIITILAGAGLGVAGAIFQGITRNPLADPGILGIHAGAGAGLMIYMTYFTSLNTLPALTIPIFTFVGGITAATLIIFFTYERHKGILPTRLLLVGIAVAAGFNALTLYLSLQLDEKTYSFAASWLLGNVWGRDWIHVYSLLPWILVLLPLALMSSKTLNSFALGDSLALSIGTKIQPSRIKLLFLAVALSSASVAMTGGIGFIGLVAPHIARRLVGPAHEHLLPISAFVGVVILVLSDTLARSIFEPSAIPAGVIVSTVGAPYFLYILFKTKK
ncbi:iron ABC transporter permease [Solibacillus sp. R5-41]|uniref:FecCD family ABC transporter permease n=1 Tax=Solibacillus sp. R5-41 TaxID=2048654 RepID=UPI000C128F18|nr:iron ABC transporter permease [Solibacillus sp. R5-41]ATP39827.1 iron ABC transporter permease [Solibacillus sp. R5-41]